SRHRRVERSQQIWQQGRARISSAGLRGLSGKSERKGNRRAAGFQKYLRSSNASRDGECLLAAADSAESFAGHCRQRVRGALVESRHRLGGSARGSGATPPERHSRVQHFGRGSFAERVLKPVEKIAWGFLSGKKPSEVFLQNLFSLCQRLPCPVETTS